SQIVSHFASTPDHIVPESREILASPIKLLVETADGVLDWVSEKPVITQPAPGAVTWESHSQAGSLGLFCSAKMEMDGYLIYRLVLKAEIETVVQDIRLEIPYVDDVAKFMVGMKHKGGLRPDKWQWEWDENSPAHQYWVGNTNAGLYCKLKHSFDAWDLHNLKESGFPSGWYNEGKGGCLFGTDKSGAYSSCAYTGQRVLKAGEELELRFSLLVTPVKPLDYARFDQRYYHWAEDIVSVDECLDSGATVINIHHGNLLNPNINYPFNHTDKLKAYLDEAHAKGAKVKVYYTVRELTNWVKEIWALKSLNNEIYTDGIRGGHSWLYEHFVDGYQRAWHMYLPDGLWDAALLTNGLSRWHNYYLEGLSWLIKNVGIDGIYLDGIGYDREIMKRVRKVMDQAKPGCLIDFHSGDPFQEQYGLLNATAVYAEHFPYINTLWFGEGFLPTYPLDFWMVEMSGIPFGLFGEMLQYGGNLHRGMLFGMPNRMYQETDASHIWKFWDLFGIRNSKMYGYWDSACPVKTNHSDVPCTIYQKEGKTLICLASWAEDKVEVKLTIDWQTLGLDESNSTLTAYPITNLQDAATFKTDSPIPIEPQRGWLLILEKS
ncbi:MAG: glycoside hydrolase domain-containing protein, partial [bacterium]